jgi:hypothetical protein
MDDAAQCPLGGVQTHANFQASCQQFGEQQDCASLEYTARRSSLGY